MSTNAVGRSGVLLKLEGGRKREEINDGEDGNI